VLGGERRARQRARAREVLGEIEALALDDLALDVLARVFGPEGPAEDGAATFERALAPYDPTGSGIFPGIEGETRDAIRGVVEEGVQRLEHAGLVLVRISGRDLTTATIRLTRAGRRALERGDARERLAG
jgi:hypothetical protein